VGVEPDEHPTDKNADSIHVRQPPHFEAGQLLTAEDLNELAQYSCYHLALRASRRLPGIVAGMHVRSAAQDRSCLVIGPGYAIGNNGDELVLRKSLTIPLRDLMDGSMPPLEGERPDGARDDLTRIKGIDVVLERKLNKLGFHRFEQIAMLNDEDKQRINEVLDFKGRYERDEWVEQAKRFIIERRAPNSIAYDLHLRPRKPAPALMSIDRDAVPAKRSYDLVLLPAADQGPEVPWLAGFNDMLGPIKTLVHQHLAEPAVGFVEAFKALIAACPPSSFPVLIDEAARLQPHPPPDARERNRLAWLYAIDRVRSHLAAEQNVNDANGLRLARVWIDPIDEDLLAVVMIDETARHAAYGRYHDLPAPPAMLNVTALVGEDCVQARARLERAGVNVRRLDALALDDQACLEALTRLVTTLPLAEVGAFYDIAYVNFDGLGARAIGLLPVASLNEDGLIAELSCDPEQALPGDQVTFTLTLENVGKEIIDIEAVSSSFAIKIPHQPLLPRARLTVNAPMDVPEGLGKDLPDSWTALGDGFFSFDARVNISSTGGRPDLQVTSELTVDDRSAIKPLLLSVEQNDMSISVWSDRKFILDFALTNHSDVGLDVDLEDADDNRIEPTPLRLEPGQSQIWRPASPPSLTAAKAFVLKATGRAGDGRRVVATTKVNALPDPLWQHVREFGWIYLLGVLFLVLLLIAFVIGGR
jgi:hypothetical protein